MAAQIAGWDDLDATLARFVDSQRGALEALGEDADRLLAAARTAVTGGKRLRAGFCWW